MQNTEHTNQPVEQALHGLDGIQRATPGPFFFTRVQARLQRNAAGRWERLSYFITRPSVALAGLCLVLLLNAAAFYFRPPVTGNTTSLSGEVGYADEFGNLASNYYYDENQEP